MASMHDTHALVLKYLEKEADALDAEERAVLEDIAEQSVTSRDASDIADEQATYWDRLSDRVAAIGGSWPFIGVSLSILTVWMLFNSEVLPRIATPFDPYPYIFLNLLLSMLAALQAPIIMMSQNRAAAKDRTAASHDYECNLRAELEIVRLHKRLDEMHGEVRTLLALLAKRES